MIKCVDSSLTYMFYDNNECSGNELETETYENDVCYNGSMYSISQCMDNTIKFWKNYSCIRH